MSNREIIQDSDIREFEVKDKDLIILASDGMYDVVTDHAIENILKNFDQNYPVIFFSIQIT
jgi:serine/threonine protein phosphatase PrpC